MGLFDGLAGAGISAATGNYLGAAIDLAGVGMSLFGGSSQSSATKQAAQQSMQISGNINKLENQANDQREVAMNLSASRQKLEQLRMSQRARAMAINNATSQNAQFGTGLQGGLSQVKAQEGFNVQGINQNQEIGENLFGLDRQISSQKLALQNVQTQLQTSTADNQGLMSLGSSLSKSGDPLSRLLQGFNLPGMGASTTMGLNGLPAIS